MHFLGAILLPKLFWLISETCFYNFIIMFNMLIYDILCFMSFLEPFFFTPVYLLNSLVFGQVIFIPGIRVFKRWKCHRVNFDCLICNHRLRIEKRFPTMCRMSWFWFREYTFLSLYLSHVFVHWINSHLSWSSVSFDCLGHSLLPTMLIPVMGGKWYAKKSTA